MGWFDSIFGNDDAGTGIGDDPRRPDVRQSRDPFGRILPEPEFDAFRSAWKAGAGLLDLFGDDPVKIKEPVGPQAPNRRPDIAKVETFLDRTGQLDLAKTEGPTGYYGSRVDQGIRRFQKDNALKVDGLINPGGPTLQRVRALLSETEEPERQEAWRTPGLSPYPKREREDVAKVNLENSTSPSPSLVDRVAEWLSSRKPAATVRTEALMPLPKREASTSPLSAKIGPAAHVPSQIREATNNTSKPSLLTPVLDNIENTYRERVEGLRRRDMPVAASNLKHFLDGSGEPRKLSRDEAIRLEPIRKSEIDNNTRFEQETFRGRSGGNEKVRAIQRMQPGSKHAFSEYWDKDFELSDYLFNAAFGRLAIVILRLQSVEQSSDPMASSKPSANMTRSS